MKLKKILRSLIDPYCKVSFLLKVKPNSNLLDVGCGNNSVKLIKSLATNVNYTGIDVGDYNLDPAVKKDINKYIVCKPSEFSNEIKKIGLYDYVISSHNLEHCDDWQATVRSMCLATIQNGMIYIATPSEKSIDFPNRAGTLNFFDDKTHKLPINFMRLKEILKENDMEVIYEKNCHNTKITKILGFLQEMKSRKLNRVLTFTWAYWGFESIIWAKKIKDK
jgi:2-polyprenyl-3-methyl-5-hydroxy-6-metoxy-1,4-benzoquinol methylase